MDEKNRAMQNQSGEAAGTIGTLLGKLDGFEEYLIGENFREQTILSYLGSVNRYLVWCEETYGAYPSLLYRQNIRDFIAYQRNIQRLAPASTNAYLSGLSSFNSYLIYIGHMKEAAVISKDRIKVQEEMTDPNDMEVSEVESFRQELLEKQGPRDHAVATIMAYAGLRISETVNLELTDVMIDFREIIVRDGKGGKRRTVIMNDKIANSVREYLKVRRSDSPFLFPSRQSKKISRSRINQIFNAYSEKITPHKLRHFYCSYSQNYAGLSLSEVANQAGHKSTRTTMRYTHPSKQQILEKINKM